jgi:hypothetical protein
LARKFLFALIEAISTDFPARPPFKRPVMATFENSLNKVLFEMFPDKEAWKNYSLARHSFENFRAG